MYYELDNTKTDLDTTQNKVKSVHIHNDLKRCNEFIIYYNYIV